MYGLQIPLALIGILLITNTSEESIDQIVINILHLLSQPIKESFTFSYKSLSSPDTDYTLVIKGIIPIITYDEMIHTQDVSVIQWSSLNINAIFNIVIEQGNISFVIPNASFNLEYQSIQINKREDSTIYYRRTPTVPIAEFNLNNLEQYWINTNFSKDISNFEVKFRTFIVDRFDTVLQVYSVNRYRLILDNVIKSLKEQPYFNVFSEEGSFKYLVFIEFKYDNMRRINDYYARFNDVYILTFFNMYGQFRYDVVRYDNIDIGCTIFSLNNFQSSEYLLEDPIKHIFNKVYLKVWNENWYCSD